MPFFDLNGTQFWMPSMSPKGYTIFQNTRRKTLLHGPRKTTKSNIAQNLLVRHCFQWDRACAAIVVRGLKSAVGSGCWNDVTGDGGILEREWFRVKELNCGWYKGGEPKQLSDTKMRYCKIRNQHGGWSEIQLHTIQDEASLHKFKDSRFSFLYFVEADGWQSEEVLRKMMMQLRSSIPHKDRQIVLDCNPPREGTDHWIYKTFIRNELDQYIPDLDPEVAEYGFTMADNPFITEEEKLEVFKAHEHDQVELDRNYYGKWVRSRKGTAYKYQFEPSRHIIGDISGEESDWTVLLPPRGCFQFPTGWDLGDATNHAVVLGAKMVDQLGRSTILIIDEFVRLGENYSISSVASRVADRMDYWERVMKSRGTPELQWSFWSDPATLRYIAAAGKSAADTLTIETDGKIRLRGSRKGKDSVKFRNTLLKRALFTGQIFISATCVNVKRMLSELVEDKNGDIDESDPNKHVFDALTYMLLNELPIQSQDEPIEERPVQM